MKVSELIELLKDADPDAAVAVRTANYMHYTLTPSETSNRREVIINAS